MNQKLLSTLDPQIAAQVALFQSMPILHEDDPEIDMGESNLHALAEHILRYCVTAHLISQPQYQVFSNLNLHYQPRFPRIFVSPDVMVVTPNEPLPEDISSYHIDSDGPPPVLVAEALSERTAEEVDLREKVAIYALIGAAEYVLLDPVGRFMPQRLLLKRLQPDLTWKDEQDADGGLTSALGFRVVFDEDGQLRVLNAKTGRRYIRPNEAEAAFTASEKKRLKAERARRRAEKERQRAEERVRELEAEIARLRKRSGGNNKQ